MINQHHDVDDLLNDFDDEERRRWQRPEMLRFVERLEDLLTTPGCSLSTDLLVLLREGKQIPYRAQVDAALVLSFQDYALGWRYIDLIRSRIFIRNV